MFDDTSTAVAAWRGQCLNYFARAEQAVGRSLESAAAAGRSVKLRHLAGHRLADLIELVATVESTDRQARAFTAALSEWQEVEPKRQFLAHGVESISTDRDGQWTVLLDVVAYRSSKPSCERWAIKQSEAEVFRRRLADAFTVLGGQLGQLRKRLSP